ncbi:MAG: hypothetical protein AAFX09_13360 [Pseudomonadota bacterium]
MIGAIFERISAGFAFADVLLWIAASLVAALVMRRWSQLTIAALLAYVADLLAPFVGRVITGIPADFAAQLAIERIDEAGAAAVLRLFMYFGLIAALFQLKHRYGAR